MNEQNKLTRRRFIALSVLGAGGVCLLGRCANPPLSPWRLSHSRNLLYSMPWLNKSSQPMNGQVVVMPV